VKHKRQKAFFGLIVLSIIALTLFVSHHPLTSFDTSLTREIQKIKHGNFDLLMQWVSYFGNVQVMPFGVLFASLVFVIVRRMREARFVLAVLIADLLNILVKLIIDRPRPTAEEALVSIQFTQSSFPSGHVVHYVVFFGFLLAVMIRDKKLPRPARITVGVSSAVLILLVSVSRIYLGAHWATDVLGAYLFGMLYLGILLTFYFKLPEGGLPSKPK
jgi:membrane-associated phospholipid phosphatase